MRWKYWTVLKTELENSFEESMLFEIKSVTPTAPYNFEAHIADVVVSIELVKMQCVSLLREMFSVGGMPRFHTYTQICKNYLICLPTVGDVWWHILVWTTVFIHCIKQQLRQSQFNRYSFVTQNFRLTLINTLRTGSFKLFKRPLPGFFLTILNL